MSIAEAKRSLLPSGDSAATDVADAEPLVPPPTGRIVAGPGPRYSGALGRAANRYVSFQIGAAIVGGIIFLIMLFAVILPAFSHSPDGPTDRGTVTCDDPTTC